MAASRPVLAVAAALFAATAWGQAAGREPHIGYLYPAGGQQGSVFQVTAGGQYLRGAADVYVSGEGVQATVIEYIRPIRPGELGNIGRHLREFVKKAQARQSGQGATAPPATDGARAKEPELEPLPDHPLLRDLENKSLQELFDLRAMLFNPKKQPNTQIAETVLLEVSINADAAPGDRELRLATGAALTNPVMFQVGGLPETLEREPNDPGPLANLRKRPVLDVPVLLNGQIMPGDVDRFRFRAEQGQRLVIDTRARHLVPYLADAVPGWFQATVALYDANGREVAFADDYRFDPDPVLFYEVPETGEYELEIHDSIYRGREDFVYRIAVGELPFITRIFPLGGRAGAETIASIDGWNLPANQLALDAEPGGAAIRQTALREGASISNAVTYAVDDLPECDEAEPNDAPADAQPIDLPLIVNGRITRPGDVDVFRFQGRAGDEVVAEVHARTLRSPLDSLVRLTDASGEVLAWNDDHMQRDEGYLHAGAGLLTHHADSYLSAGLPEDGTYHVRVSDSQDHGGDAYAYRLRITPPQPDFALRVAPSSVNVRAGRDAAVWVHALRMDGFDGAIDVSLRGAPAGFSLYGGRIPAGRDSIRVTLRAPKAWIRRPFALEVEGRAQIGDQTVSHLAVPADDMMQAFLYRHLAPSQLFMVKVLGAGRFAPVIELADAVPLQIPAGGTARLRVAAPQNPMLQELQLELSGPPDGVALQEVSAVPGGFALTLAAGADAPQVGYADNLIVEASVEMEMKRPDGTATGQKRRVPFGVLPAIPFEIVQG
jgi:hypothetical protein